MHVYSSSIGSGLPEIKKSNTSKAKNFPNETTLTLTGNNNYDSNLVHIRYNKWRVFKLRPNYSIWENTYSKW